MSAFDLSRALAAWRTRLEQRGAFLPDDLDELESHLRDHVATLVAAGHAPHPAFLAALDQLGTQAALEREFGKVRMGRTRRRHVLARALRSEGALLKSYLAAARRALRREKGYATINVAGLAVGVACCLLALLYLRHEYSFDTFHANGDRIYRILNYAGFAEKEWGGYVAGDPTADLRGATVGVEDATKIHSYCIREMTVRGERFADIEAECAESNLFGIFSLGLQQGDPATVLDRPYTAVVTRSLAERVFGDEDPVGQTFTSHLVDGQQTFEITGMMDDLPVNSHLTFDLLVSYASLESTPLCLTCGQPMYALLAPGTDPDSIAASTLAIIRGQGKDNVEDVRLEPLREVHFSPVHGAGDKRYVYLLTGIAVLILLIACANYINLATARALRRTREVGVRKAVGALRGQLTQQFLAETVVVALLAIPLALGLLLAVRPTFNALAETGVALSGLVSLPFLGGMLGVVVLVGLVAGGYPAFLLSRLPPVASLKGQMGRELRGSALRRVLIVFQFAASLVLLIGTTVVLQQLRHMQTQKLGFDTDQIVTVRVGDPVLAQQPDVVKQALASVTGVERVSAGGSGPPGGAHFGGMRFGFQRSEDDETRVSVVHPAIDAAFLETMGIPLLAGRNVGEVPRAQPPEEVLVNEAAVALMGWATPEEAVGQLISDRSEVVGVVPDFHFQSLHHPVEPLMLQHSAFQNASSSRYTLRLAGGDIPATLDRLKAAWQRLDTDVPFDYQFLTDDLTAQYEAERRTAKVFGLFAGLAVLLACLGLFGLAALATAQRTKEIGIRKVLGASDAGIVAMLTKDVAVLVLVAVAVAVPIALYVVRRWLEAFAYPAALSWWLFALGGLAMLGLAVLTVGAQAIRAVQRRPAESLRYE